MKILLKLDEQLNDSKKEEKSCNFNNNHKDTYLKLVEYYLRLELLKVFENKERTEALGPVRLMWLLG